MATVRLISDDEAAGDVRAVFHDIRATRGTDYLNNFWRALAIDPVQLASVWAEVKAVIEEAFHGQEKKGEARSVRAFGQSRLVKEYMAARCRLPRDWLAPGRGTLRIGATEPPTT